MRALIVAIVLPCFLVMAQAGEEKGKNGDKKDSERFQGTWKVVSWEIGGNTLPEEGLEGIRFVFKKDKYEFQAGDNSEDGTFKLDPAAKPRKIDLAIKSGNDEGKMQLGLYEFDKDRLKICFAMAGADERPNEFAAKEEPRSMVLILERIKAEK